MQHRPFESLSLDPRLLRAIAEEGYTHPTPIQAQAIPLLLDGEDLLATAQTGTGKTAAFALPILQVLTEDPPLRPGSIRALVLAPTRELALQVEASFRTYGRYMGLETAVLLGGVPARAQIQALRQRPEILVATPGRLIDLHEQGHVRLNGVEILVLDEADRMLDMGFIDDVRRIVGELPLQRQTMMFSATLSDGVASLASDMLHEPMRVAVTPPASVSGQIEQQVMFVDAAAKLALLAEVLSDPRVTRSLVFTRTKYRADRVVAYLNSAGIRASAIHSNKAQPIRQQTLNAFHSGRIRVLVATDIVARGIDVEDISHVVNFQLPEDPENYVHRIGRTARAGADGIAVSFCDVTEVPMLEAIERLTGAELTVVRNHPYHSVAAETLHRPKDTEPASRFSRRSSGWRSFRPKRLGLGR